MLQTNRLLIVAWQSRRAVTRTNAARLYVRRSPHPRWPPNCWIGFVWWSSKLRHFLQAIQSLLLYGVNLCLLTNKTQLVLNIYFWKYTFIKSSIFLANHEFDYCQMLKILFKVNKKCSTRNCQIKVESRHNQDNSSDDITYVGETAGGGARGRPSS